MLVYIFIRKNISPIRIICNNPHRIDPLNHRLDSKPFLYVVHYTNTSAFYFNLADPIFISGKNNRIRVIINRITRHFAILQAIFFFLFPIPLINSKFFKDPITFNPPKYWKNSNNNYYYHFDFLNFSYYLELPKNSNPKIHLTFKLFH